MSDEKKTPVSSFLLGAVDKLREQEEKFNKRRAKPKRNWDTESYNVNTESGQEYDVDGKLKNAEIKLNKFSTMVAAEFAKRTEDLNKRKDEFLASEDGQNMRKRQEEAMAQFEKLFTGKDKEPEKDGKIIPFPDRREADSVNDDSAPAPFDDSSRLDNIFASKDNPRSMFAERESELAERSSRAEHFDSVIDSLRRDSPISGNDSVPSNTSPDLSVFESLEKRADENGFTVAVVKDSSDYSTLIIKSTIDARKNGYEYLTLKPANDSDIAEIDGFLTNVGPKFLALDIRGELDDQVISTVEKLAGFARSLELLLVLQVDEVSEGKLSANLMEDAYRVTV